MTPEELAEIEAHADRECEYEHCPLPKDVYALIEEVERLRGMEEMVGRLCRLAQEQDHRFKPISVMVHPDFQHEFAELAQLVQYKAEAEKNKESNNGK